MPPTRITSPQVGDGQIATADIADGAVTEGKQTLADVTTHNVSTTKHGYAPKLDNNANNFLNGQGNYTSPDHGNLGGLTDDDHSQYALLAGRSGGQVLKGGTASGNNLELHSTSHSTKGLVLAKDQLYAEAGLCTARTSYSLTSNVNNLAMSNNRSWLDINPSGAGWEITGINATGIQAGFTLTIRNTGSQYFILKDNSGSSSAGNRFLFDLGSDYYIGGGGQTITLVYDGTFWVQFDNCIPITRVYEGIPIDADFIPYHTSAGSYRGVNRTTIQMLRSQAMPKGYIDGYILSNNGSDASNDIDISAGACKDSTNAYALFGSAMTKRLDASWTAGTNQGGLDTGSEANSTWYHVWAILKDSDYSVDYLFSTSATAPTMPSGYTYKRRLGSIYNDSSGNIKPFSQYGDEFLWKDPVLDLNGATLGSSASLWTLSVPTGVKVMIALSLGATSASSNYGVLTCPDQTDVAPSFIGAGGIEFQDASIQPILAWAKIRSNTSAQIRARATGNITIYLRTLGWIDPRGKE